MRIAIIRIRGTVRTSKRVEDTLTKLKLFKKNHCAIIKDTPDMKGMLMRIKDCCTFGEIDAKTFEELLTKRGRIIGGKPLTEAWVRQQSKMDIKQFADKFMKGETELKDVPGLKPYFKLNPPRKGFEKEGIKKPYSTGGALGYRKDKINELIGRMI